MNRQSFVLRLLLCVAVGLALGAVPASSAARGARPDRSFGGGKGWVVTRIPGTSTSAGGVAVVEGGAIVIVGQAITPSGNGQILVVRYRPNGQLDRSFGSRGIFRSALPVGKGPFLGTSIVEDRLTGKLRGASRSHVRRKPNWLRDGSSRWRRSIDRAPAERRSSARWLNENVSGRPMVVARFTRAGLLDRRFGRAGLSQILFWNRVLAAGSTISGLATVPCGGVIGFGHLDYIGGDGHGSAGVFKLSPNGRLVRSFGSAGHVEIAFPHGTGKSQLAQWFPCVMTVDSGGRTTVTGDGSTTAGPALLSARLTTQGVLDRTYGPTSDGRAVIRGLNAQDETTCGSTSTVGGGLTVGVGSVLAQLRPGGAANGRFGRNGMLTITTPPNVNINGLARSGSSRIVLAGFAGSSAYVARYWLPTPESIAP